MAGNLLVPTLDLGPPLGEVLRLGAAHVEEALSPEACAALWRETEGAAFRELPAEVGPVRQQVEGAELHDPLDAYPAVRQLRDELVAGVRRAAATPALAGWWPDDVSVQRYRPASAVGITPHRDGRRYALLVAVFTVAGRARFSLHRERAGEAVAGWVAGPGDLVLLRGPGLTGPDDRPFHSVGPPLDSALRCSLGFRMDSRRQVPASAPGE